MKERNKMARYIDADAFDERIRISVGLVEEELTDDYKDGVRCTLEMLKTQPTADVVERKHGEWIQHVNEPSLWSCSICETVIYSEHEEDRLKFHKWCGCCGADMRGGNNDGR